MRRRLTFVTGFAMLVALAVGGCAIRSADSRDATPEREAIAFERLEQLYADLFATDAPVPGWNDDGDDPFGEEAAGDIRWLLLEDRSGRRQLVISADRHAMPSLPRDWRRIESWSDDSGPAVRAFIQIQPIDDRFIFVARGGARRMGGAFCARGGAELDLYERPDGSSPRDARETVRFVGYLFARTRVAPLCSRYDTLGGGRFALRNFTEQGRPLTTLDQQGEIGTLVRPGPIEGLLGLD